MPDINDGRVTLALLGQDMGYLKQDIAELRAEVGQLSELVTQTIRDNTARISKLEQCEAVDNERWVEHRAEHQRQFSVQSLIAAVASALAAIAGIFVQKP